MIVGIDTNLVMRFYTNLPLRNISCSVVAYKTRTKRGVSSRFKTKTQFSRI